MHMILGQMFVGVRSVNVAVAEHFWQNMNCRDIEEAASREKE